MNDMNDKQIVGRKKKLSIGLLFLVSVSVLGLVSILIINLFVTSSVKDKIITVDEAALLDSDCILILGAGVWDGGRPSYMLEDRLLQGIELYENGAADRLLMSKHLQSILQVLVKERLTRCPFGFWGNLFYIDVQLRIAKLLYLA